MENISTPAPILEMFDKLEELRAALEVETDRAKRLDLEQSINELLLTIKES